MTRVKLSFQRAVRCFSPEQMCYQQNNWLSILRSPLFHARQLKVRRDTVEIFKLLVFLEISAPVPDGAVRKKPQRGKTIEPNGSVELHVCDTTWRRPRPRDRCSDALVP